VAAHLSALLQVIDPATHLLGASLGADPIGQVEESPLVLEELGPDIRPRCPTSHETVPRMP
jgi:hypothetical protein